MRAGGCISKPRCQGGAAADRIEKRGFVIPLSVGLIGIGRVAEGYDMPSGPGVNTHLKALLRNPDFHVAMLSDADSAKAAATKKRWGLSAEIVTPNVFFESSLDIFCIATPDDTHGE